MNRLPRQRDVGEPDPPDACRGERCAGREVRCRREENPETAASGYEGKKVAHLRIEERSGPPLDNRGYDSRRLDDGVGFPRRRGDGEREPTREGAEIASGQPD